MEKKYTFQIILLAVSLLIFPAAAGAGSKWQNLLEKNQIPAAYWQNYLPNVNLGEYNKAMDAYYAALGQENTDIENDSEESENEESETEIIEGKYPLPDKSGKISIEQHLWLSSGQSASSHYNMTGASKSSQNGMAGGYGVFGPLSNSDRQEEKYYVTMRWGYADWIEPSSKLAQKISATDKSLILKDASGFPRSGYIKIESEYIRYSSRSGNKLKGLTRGYKSSARAHNKTDSLYLVYRYKGGQWERQTKALNISSKKRAWYKGKKVLVTNKRNGKQVVASILESGPAIWTGRVGGLSPEAFLAISAKNNENCTFQYVDEGTKLGLMK